MSSEEFKAKVMKHGKLVEFGYKLLMLLLLSLCLKGVTTGFNGGKELVVGTVKDFHQLKVDRDSDRAEHLVIAKWKSEQDEFNSSISDSVLRLEGIAQAHQQAIIDINNRLLTDGK